MALLVCGGLQLGCGGPSLYRADPGGLSHGGVSLAVPSGWSGRILFTDREGTGAVFEVANFKLASQIGLEPPKEVPAGHEDRIKGMAGDDLLIVIETSRGDTSQHLPIRITKTSLNTVDSVAVPVPAGHAVGREAGCLNRKCVSITVDFARPPPAYLLRSANDVLASLKVSKH
jgi:hypothetical protein